MLNPTKRVYCTTLLIIGMLFIFSCRNHTSQYIAFDNSRPYYMGFSPWQYDSTFEALDWTYARIAAEGDIISHHMEEGVPWPEAYSGAAFPASFQAEIEGRVTRKVAGQKVVLQISPLNVARNGMALYRGNTPNEALPSLWDTYALDSDQVKTAFLNYAERMIGYFQPDYLLIGVEVNLLIRNNDALWAPYVALNSYVYTELKKTHPSLPVSVSVFCVPYFPQWSTVDNAPGLPGKQAQGLIDLSPHIDFISYSVHPFMSGLLAETFPDDYLDTLFNLLPGKPVAVSESSYPAQVWSLGGLTFNGSQEKQKNFLSLLLSSSRRAQAEFVIWFAIRDYDALWSGLLNSSDAALPWRDTGLYDEAGNERTALSTWRSVFFKAYR